jgi:hypothetical protein
MEAVPVARPIIQQIYGVARLTEKSPVVFSLAGYTRDAKEWADRAEVALFRFDLQGVPAPSNPTAGQLAGGM